MQSTAQARRIFSHSGLVPVATILANVLSYALFLAAARLLDRATYGETLALLSLITVATIPSFAIQTVIARRVATGTLMPRTVRIVLAVGLTGGALLATASPFLVSFMRLSSYGGVLGAAASVPSLALIGLAIGFAQGRRQWGLLSGGLLLMGIGRVGGGLVGLFVNRSAAGALLGTAVGLAVCAAIAMRAVLRPLREFPVDQTQRTRSVLAELTHAAHAHGSFLLLTSLDLILARNILSAEDAGLYAAGNVVFRAALWLPQPVQMMLFATMSDLALHRSRVRHGVAVVAGLVGGTILGCVLLGELVTKIVGGEDYLELAGYIWVFAVAGGGLALIQFAVYAGLAIQRRGRLAIVWSCIAAEIGVMITLGSGTRPEGFITAIALVVGVAAAIAVAIALLTQPDPADRVTTD